MDPFEELFLKAGPVRVSEAALQMALEFADAIGAEPGGRRLVAFDWAESYFHPRNRMARHRRMVGACLLLGAFERHEVPEDCIERAGRFEYAVQMPSEVLAQCVERFIDVDETKPFRLALL